MNFYPKSLFFDAETGGAAGGTPAPDAGVPAGAPPNTPTGGGQEPGEAPPSEIRLTTTQLSERLERAKGSAKLELAKTLGFDSLEAMQSAIKAGQDAVKDKMSEAERTAAALKAAQDAAAEARTQLEAATKAANAEKIRSAAVELMAGKFAKPGSAFKLLDLAGVEVQADGTVKGLKDAVDRLAQDEPWTLAVAAPPKLAPKTGPTNPENGGAPSGETDDDRRQRYFGTGPGAGGFFRGSGVKPAVEKKPK